MNKWSICNIFKEKNRRKKAKDNIEEGINENCM